MEGLQLIATGGALPRRLLAARPGDAAATRWSSDVNNSPV